MDPGDGLAVFILDVDARPLAPRIYDSSGTTDEAMFAVMRCITLDRERALVPDNIQRVDYK